MLLEALPGLNRCFAKRLPGARDPSRAVLATREKNTETAKGARGREAVQHDTTAHAAYVCMLRARCFPNTLGDRVRHSSCGGELGLLEMTWSVLVAVLLTPASDGSKRLGAAAVQAGVVPCNAKHESNCCGDGKCTAPENEITCMGACAAPPTACTGVCTVPHAVLSRCACGTAADCPGVITDETCGEEPHSDRAGKGLTFGVSHRAKSAQDCCDKCKANARGCNSWTFCGYPVCWGLDTGWNHTFGEVQPKSVLSAMPCREPSAAHTVRARRVCSAGCASWRTRPSRPSGSAASSRCDTGARCCARAVPAPTSTRPAA